MQNFMKTILSGVKAWTKDEIKNSTADWNENDSSKDSYVKNRTHYEELIINEILPQTELNFSATGWDGIRNLNVELNLKNGETYTVFWDGVEYSCICYSYSGEALGDGGFSGLGNDEPFFLWSSGNVISNTTGAHTICVKEVKTIIHTLDAKYLPKSIGGKSDWNASEGEVGYVENRTHWEKIDSVAIIPETTISANNYCWVESNYNMSIEEGQEYNVFINGVKYKCIARLHYSSSDGDEYLLGNGTIYGDGDSSNEEPFSIAIMDSWRYGVSFYFERSFEGTLSVCVDVTSAVQPLDEKFVPDSIARIEDVLHKNNPVGTGSFSLNRKPDTEIGNYSFAEGFNTVASGNGSHAEGQNTIASGEYSHAEGDGTTAQTLAQHVQGQFNIVDADGSYATRGTYVHIVGNGTSDVNCSNAHTLDWEGNAWFSGDVYVGSNSGINKDEGSKKLATEEYVNDTKDYIQIKDAKNDCEYIIKMENGNLISFCKCSYIKIAQMPTKLEYTKGEIFDPSGMVVTAICQDGTVRNINNYTYSQNPIMSSSIIEIKYVECNMTHTTSIKVSATKPFDPDVELVDFDYVANTDGTYTITAWKETLKGEPSTEMIVPNNNLIIV